ncbi:DUF4276 family protein [Mesorhizobium sp. M0700]|uniref:hypothetical protein n=1 Tax=unclassified Mesorhizobium TaxID=325217 RepID=UPI0033392FEE
MLRVFVEGKMDCELVVGLLRQADLSRPDITVTAVSGNLDPKRQTKRTSSILAEAVGPKVVVFDLEAGNIADVPPDIRQRENTSYCPAIPTIEAWLFADELALADSIPEGREGILSRLPAPENIPYPKMLRHYLLRDENIGDITFRIDINRAAARSPSLSNFLNTVQNMVGMKSTFEIISTGSKYIDKNIISSLISEVYPSTTTIFRMADGRSFTAGELMHEISDGTQLGQAYASELLRVARDLIKNQANHEDRRKK